MCNKRRYNLWWFQSFGRTRLLQWNNNTEQCLSWTPWESTIFFSSWHFFFAASPGGLAYPYPSCPRWRKRDADLLCRGISGSDHCLDRTGRFKHTWRWQTLHHYYSARWVKVKLAKIVQWLIFRCKQQMLINFASMSWSQYNWCNWSWSGRTDVTS